MKEERARTEPALQAEKTGKDQIEEWKKDGEDFAELLKGLTEEEKREVKGILIGMQITRDRPLTARQTPAVSRQETEGRTCWKAYG